MSWEAREGCVAWPRSAEVVPCGERLWGSPASRDGKKALRIAARADRTEMIPEVKSKVKGVISRRKS